MLLKKTWLFVLAGVLLTLPAQALSSRDFKSYLNSYEFYKSHAKDGDIALLAIGDEGATFASIVNLKTKRRFEIRYDQVQPSGNTELIFFPTISNNDFVPAPEASGIHATDLKTINVEFLYEDGTCQRYELKWENRQNAYILGDQGRGKCFIKTVR